MKLLVIDNQPLIRHSIRELLEGFHNIALIEEAGNGREGVNKIDRIHPDLVILDITLPLISGFDILSHIKSIHGNIRSIVYSICIYRSVILKSIELGACGFVRKDKNVHQLKEAIISVLDDRPYFLHEPQNVSYMNIERFASKEKQSGIYLTEREIEMAYQIIAGFTNKEIAGNFGLSHRTVEAHKRNLRQKLKKGEIREELDIWLKRKLG